MKNEIFKLKVSKSRTGAAVPFPLLYLFPAQLLPNMRRAFSSFIGFPVRHQRNIQWGDVLVARTIVGVTRQNSTYCGKTLGGLIPDLYRRENPWHVAVPILNRNRPPRKDGDPTHTQHSEDTSDPRDLYGGQADYSEEDEPVLGYLVDKRWRKEGKVTQPAYPRTTYFATKDRIHAPICGSCPLYPNHVAGKCTVGDAVCFDAFRKYYAPNMFSKLRAYDVFVEALKAKES